ncbi:MAG TPA: 4Fe-4S dicluster domain-containing protein [Candidatus Acidoferrales bacterium]|nr:4Fe-4S dicluster domain-containing protein [Candidatus Acidoferrales bacterium]
MTARNAEAIRTVVMDAKDLPRLLAAISSRGYELHGPTIREGAIVYDRLNSAEDLPRGWTDEQGAGKYRLARRQDEAYFGYNVGPHSWKKLLHVPASRLWSCKKENGSFQIIDEKHQRMKRAFIGVRSCELHAIAIQDCVLIGGAFVDPEYRCRREDVFLVAVNCGQAGGTCFCDSMKTGPRAASGYDLTLTEAIEGGEHYFVIETGSEEGEAVLREVPHREAREADREAIERTTAKAASQMGRTMNTAGLKELLYRNYDHPRWDDVAKRCLTCANCTMVCPTCFCTTIEDVTDLEGQHAERWRKWDSCFTMDFSYLHGGSVRASAKSRYRQWMTHKLASWVDQFGEAGCVGCGRCITWCPVGIDITEEVRAIRATEPASKDALQKETP